MIQHRMQPVVDDTCADMLSHDLSVVTEAMADFCARHAAGARCRLRLHSTGVGGATVGVPR